MRNKFDEQLSQLHNSIINMGDMCSQAIELATSALISFTSSEEDTEERIFECAKKTMAIDKEIDKAERDIENLCFKLLLHQQPVAKDLRKISAALKMISDMERIGDQASDISEIIEYIPDGKIRHKIHINEMSRAASEMVRKSVDAFVSCDVALAREVIRSDDELDELFCRVKTEITEEISKGKYGGECIDLLMIAKYLERIGDHATNIAEWAEYASSGVHKNSEFSVE